MCTKAGHGLRPFSIVVAAAADGGIGKDNKLPWRLKGDMAFFKDITTTAPEGQRNAVIMGRKTWESLPPKFRPLPQRRNIVLSRALSAGDLPEDVPLARSLDEALSADVAGDVADVFVIGGGEIYRQALAHPLCHRVYLTRVYGDFDCDAFFPDVDEAVFKLATRSDRHTEGDIQYEFCTYERC